MNTVDLPTLCTVSTWNYLTYINKYSALLDNEDRLPRTNESNGHNFLLSTVTLCTFVFTYKT